MTSTVVCERVRRVADACATAGAGRSAITGALDDVARIESWAAARRAELVRALRERPGSFPEADVADSTGTTLNAAAKETERASTLDRAGSFADALDAGEIRPGHVDALTRAAKGLDDAQTAELFDLEAELAGVAASSSIRDFETARPCEGAVVADRGRRRRTARASEEVDAVAVVGRPDRRDVERVRPL